ncbi:probable cytochrome P450 301a1, mitochondrial isoform X2 [Thrips palmi]|uniref:Probable cytochrome P450 301a1, mitochondrial isoform X2 n=1 Tax=Thrips palmi TaxID=161013 RepID=A0A6P8YWQ8_THRPL|nr:probable cytochrome P450 301a1, mitochondrial isoform X2 [Thrips palmi]
MGTLARGLTAPARCANQILAVRLRSTITVSPTLDEAATPDSRPFSEVPGPKPVPIFGNIWRFIPGIGDLAGITPYDLPGELVRRYGPVVKLEGLFTTPRLFVADPECVQQVFRTEGQWPIREGISSIDYYYKHYRKNLEFSLGTANGEMWQKFRSTVNQVAMQPRNVKVYVEPIDAVSEQFIQRIQSLRDENLQLPDDFLTEMKKWAGESITYVALDTRLGLLEDNLDPQSETGRIIGLVQDVFESMAKLEFGLSPWKLVSTPTWRKLKFAMDVFTEMATKRVDDVALRLAKMSKEELESRQLSVLERLLINSKDPAKGVAFALDMMLAGIDTTANQTSFLLYLLATNPDQQRTLQAELDREWAPGAPLTAALLERLKYTRAAIKESLRLMPVVTGILRTSNQDLNMKGYHIPKGTTTICSTYVMCKSKEFVPRPDDFLPERWLPGNESLKPTSPFVNIPFGFGPRMCAGKRFADLEMEVLCAKLLRKYSLEWHHPKPEVQQQLFVTFTSPLKITMKER